MVKLPQGGRMNERKERRHLVMRHSAGNELQNHDRGQKSNFAPKTSYRTPAARRNTLNPAAQKLGRDEISEPMAPTRSAMRLSVFSQS
jgi:hypothetical protein